MRSWISLFGGGRPARRSHRKTPDNQRPGEVHRPRPQQVCSEFFGRVLRGVSAAFRAVLVMSSSSSPNAAELGLGLPLVVDSGLDLHFDGRHRIVRALHHGSTSSMSPLSSCSPRYGAHAGSVVKSSSTTSPRTGSAGSSRSPSPASQVQLPTGVPSSLTSTTSPSSSPRSTKRVGVAARVARPSSHDWKSSSPDARSLRLGPDLFSGPCGRTPTLEQRLDTRGSLSGGRGTRLPTPDPPIAAATLVRRRFAFPKHRRQGASTGPSGTGMGRGRHPRNPGRSGLTPRTPSCGPLVARGYGP